MGAGPQGTHEARGTADGVRTGAAGTRSGGHRQVTRRGRRPQPWSCRPVCSRLWNCGVPPPLWGAVVSPPRTARTSELAVGAVRGRRGAGWALGAEPRAADAHRTGHRCWHRGESPRRGRRGPADTRDVQAAQASARSRRGRTARGRPPHSELRESAETRSPGLVTGLVWGTPSYPATSGNEILARRGPAETRSDG